MYAIAETFLSVQGEGRQAGQAAFFIRFHGCNLVCNFGNGFVCDDDAHVSKPISELTALDLVIQARKAGTHNIVLTGGEVSLDPNISKLIRYFRHEGYFVAVETNGVKIERLLDANLITYSPKIGFARKARQISYDDYLSLGHSGNIELKLLAGEHHHVDTGRWDSYALKYVQAIGNAHTFDDANMKYCVDFVTHNPEWYLSTQLQKLYKVD